MKTIVVKIQPELYLGLKALGDRLLAARQELHLAKEAIRTSVEAMAPEGEVYCVHEITSDGHALVHVESLADIVNMTETASDNNNDTNEEKLNKKERTQ